MSKTSTASNVWHSSQINANTEESGIEKHIRFWDKTNKGYITPLDTISGFITLGYSVIFSVAIGTIVGIFLSLSTQTGWIPDPLCRSNVQNLISSKQQTQNNSGAFDDDGVFVPEKFDHLFDKYAKSDKSGKTITIAELTRMTQEQERLGKDAKAWAACIVELSTAYFFIGHRGCLTREDVRSAYDGSMFYRLKDDHRLMIQDKKGMSYTENGLKGSYLSKPVGILSKKAVEQRLLLLYSTLQSKSYGAVNQYHLQDWFSYIQDGTKTLNNALPRALKRPNSIINGVTTPKPSMHKPSSKIHDDPSELFPEGLTGVAKIETESSPMGTDFLSSLLHQGSGDDLVGTRGLLSTSDELNSMDSYRESIIFPKLTTNEGALLTSTDSTLSSYQSASPNPTASSSISSTNESLMNGFLREESDNEWLAGGLTGVLPDSKDSMSEPVKKTTNKPQQPHQMPTPPPQSDHHEEVPKAAITPPPEEKSPVELQTSEDPSSVPINPSNNNTKKQLPVNNKKVKRKNKNKSGQISPISTSDSGQEHISPNPTSVSY